MTGEVTQEITQPFRPRPRVLQLLGNELIASDRLAVIELVKNAYDADTSHVTVRMDLDRPIGSMITVRDDGTGMKYHTLEQWVQAVNQHGGFDQWSSAVSYNPGDIKDILAKHAATYVPPVGHYSRNTFNREQ